MTNNDERRACVVDLLSFFESVMKSFANALGLPPFDVMSAPWTYGLNLQNAVIHFRKASPSFVYGLKDMSLREFVHFLIVPGAFPKYVQWIRKLKEIVDTGRVSATHSFDSISISLKGSDACLVATSPNPKVQAQKLNAFKAAQKPNKTQKEVKVSQDSTLGEVFSELATRLSIKDGIDQLSAVANDILSRENAAKKRSMNVATENALASLVSRMRKRMARAVAGRSIKDTSQEVLGVVIADDSTAAEPFLDVLDRFIIVVDDMTLQKGSVPDLRIDASSTLADLSALLLMVVERTRDNDGRAKDYLLAVLSVLSKVFEASSSKVQIKNEKVIERLEKYAFRAKDADKLSKLGVVGKKKMNGGAPEVDPPPYPYGQQQQQQQQQMQHVQIHEDPYMKLMAGLSVGAQCCTCCAMYEMADAMDGISNSF